MANHQACGLPITTSSSFCTEWVGSIADPAVISDHLDAVSGVVPGGGMQIITNQVHSLTANGSKALGFAAVLGLATSLWSANQGTKALFDALNVVYDETISMMLAKCQFCSSSSMPRLRVSRRMARMMESRSTRPSRADNPISRRTSSFRRAHRRPRRISRQRSELAHRHIRAIAEKGRMAWQKSTGYGRRSLIETAIGRYKNIIGSRLRARTLAAQQGEIAIAVEALNRMIRVAKPISVRVT